MASNIQSIATGEHLQAISAAEIARYHETLREIRQRYPDITQPSQIAVLFDQFGIFKGVYSYDADATLCEVAPDGTITFTADTF